MSVNKIDFTLGSYNPNQAAGLIAMAQENDRKISDNLKGILDGFEKTARSNADVQAMNYINSLGLQDMTPDKMPEHTQALEQIAGNMGGLNPSKEALTALDGRGNVLTQRAINDVSLATNQHNWKITKDKYDYETALPVLADAYQSMQSLNGDISVLDNAIRNFAGDTSSEEYTALTKQRDQLIADYSRTYEDYSTKAGTLSPYYTNNLSHNIGLFNTDRVTEKQNATNNLNKSVDTASGRLSELYAPVIHQVISSRFQTSVGDDGKTITVDTTTGKPVTGDEVNKVMSDMFYNYGLTGEAATMTINKIGELQARAQKEAFDNNLALKGVLNKEMAIKAQIDIANVNNQTKREIAAAQLEASVAASQTKAAADAAKDDTKVTATNPNLRYNTNAQKLNMATWANEKGEINVSQINNDVSSFIKDTNDRVAKGYYDPKKGDFVKGGVTNWYLSDEGSKLLNSLESSGYVAKGKSAQVFNNYFNNAPEEIKKLLPTTAHKVEFIKYLATSKPEDHTSTINKFFLTLPRGTNGTMPLNLILGLDAEGKFSDVGRAEGNNAVVKAAATAASNSVKSLKGDTIRNYLNPRIKVLTDAASLNNGLHTPQDVISKYGLNNIKEIQDLYGAGSTEEDNPFNK